MKLWYQKPAECWSEALPVGNGRYGGMVFGNPQEEVIQINEDSIWSGKKLDRINPDAPKKLKEIRNLIRAGKIEEAQELTLYALSGVPNSQRSYQTAGECYIHMHNIDDITHYYRDLDLEEGIANVQFVSDGITYQREVIASAPAGCMAIHMTTKERVPFSFDCHLGRKHNFTDEILSEDGKMVRFLVDGGKEGISFCTNLSVDVQPEWMTKGGSVEIIGEFLVVKNVTECVLYLDTETSFRYSDYIVAARERCLLAESLGWERFRKQHIEDYQRLYRRMQLHYGQSDIKMEEIPTDVRLKQVQNGMTDMGLLELYFQYGRYLLISSSREGSLPANLQGIWNDSLTPPWESKYTVNINTEMNYWMAETANLSECHLPLFEHLQRICENGKETARRMYGCNGSVCHHNTDIYADTAPQDHCITSAFWVMGEAWLATHIWEHYLFTKDKKFLSENFYVLEQSVLFFYDFLIEGKNGTLVTSPSLSPENTYQMEDGTLGVLCESPTMDTEILLELFHSYIGACQVLGKSKEEISKAEAVKKRFPPLKIGKYGQLLEWMEDYEEPEPGHRHISHLYGLYPGNSISKECTPELFNAAYRTLERRLENGGGHTGWSRAWIIGLWAAFGNGEKAYENLNAILCMGTFPNLMDNHPMLDGYVFQIDGNFGAAAAMIEMLVKSKENRIELLPAITEKTKSGCLSGVRLRCGAELAMNWEDGKVIALEIYPDKILEEKWPVILCVNGTEHHILLERNVKFIDNY
ncbi:MAG: glycoside hydrolase family 95 protein [Lachnospiraceae bacterium]|uniref:glycoside hydrolase family 95 protein n=1 Tax=Blautia sp. TaxID=1955243 RepID=UPI001DF08618|nr:glycoside hydrolase family 95 protein [Blautia sp.]MBS5131258.1 glycoside hydrolase family 95 protein [Lachnospiraceae bacterium]